VVTANSNSGKGMINVPPITDELAARAAFVYRNDGGYIDNVGTGVKGFQYTLIGEGRTEVLFIPVEGTKLSYLQQHR
jgi:iron complex outermembrane recepter protein